MISVLKPTFHVHQFKKQNAETDVEDNPFHISFKCAVICPNNHTKERLSRQFVTPLSSQGWLRVTKLFPYYKLKDLQYSIHIVKPENVNRSQNRMGKGGKL